MFFYSYGPRESLRKQEFRMKVNYITKLFVLGQGTTGELKGGFMIFIVDGLMIDMP